ncbi:MAG: metallophosphoesterase [Candidatus Pacearchaeota archaeon]
MRILVIGDFHGKFPEKLKKIAKKVDIIVSLGDYTPFTLRKEFFKYCYGKDVELWEAVGKSRYKKVITNDFKKGENILKKLNELSVPVVSVLGNIDYPLADDVNDIKRIKGKKSWKWDEDRTKYLQRAIKKYKNIQYIDYNAFIFRGIVFIGARGHSHPGRVKSSGFRKHKKILDKLFYKYRKKKIIFVSHVVPNNTKLDKIRDKKAHKWARGKHFGSKLMRRIVDKWHPILNLSGHFHENIGEDRLGKTLIVNPGAAVEGKAAIIDFNEEKGKINKIKFIK